MFDKAKLLVRINPEEVIPYYHVYDEEGRPREIEYCCIVFTADQSGTYRAQIKNLRLTITRNFEYFIIENSFHKYYHGNNHGNFLFSEFLEVCDELIKTFSLDPDEVKVLPFEFGINIKMSPKLIDYIAAYKKKKISEMLHGHIMYGKKAFRSQYNVKVYDKRQEVKFHDKKDIEDTIRIEIEYKKMTKVPFIKTLSDMMQPENILQLYLELLNVYWLLDKDPLFDTSKHTRSERLLLNAGLNPPFWKIENRVNPNTAKKDRLLYNKLMRQNRNVDLYSNVEDEMINAMRVTLQSVLDEI